MNRQKISQASASLISQNQRAKKRRQKQVRKHSAYRYNLFSSIVYRTQKYKVNGRESESFNRRTYQLPIESLKHVTRQTVGFTNQVLCQKGKEQIHIFVPVSVTMKVKNIQEISLDELFAKIGCVLIIFIYVEGLPREIISHLSQKIMVQTNRGDSFLLRATEESGKITLNKNRKFLTFTIRDSFPVQIIDDVFLSPFEILNLIFSITVNSTIVKIASKGEGLLQNSIGSVSQNSSQEYHISFNSMRHPMEIPITYASECKLGIYDLAEQLLEIYSTNKPTFQETIGHFEDFIVKLEGETSNSSKANQKGDKTKEGSKADEVQKKSEICQRIHNKNSYNFEVPESRENEALELVLEQKKIKKEKNVKYFQYTHFVIPLYKLPGNSFSTIFIPMFMLSVLSIFIFLQQTSSFQDQLGSIATFVLGFIALIPSIKSQLPPSQKITISQIIVYTESVNCMLSLPDKYWNTSKKPRSLWTNKLFLISMTVHLICLMVVLALLSLHYFVWQRRYNLNKEPVLSSPKDHFKAWSNPYCDQQFIKFNEIARREKKYDKIIAAWPIQNVQKVKKQMAEQEL